MNIVRAKDYKDMSRKAANIISAEVIIKPHCVLGLALMSSWRNGIARAIWTFPK